MTKNTKTILIVAAAAVGGYLVYTKVLKKGAAANTGD